MPRNRSQLCVQTQKEQTVTIVSTLEQLQLSEPTVDFSFELTDSFTDPICLPVVQNLSSHLRAVIKALKNSKAVLSITFVAHQWKGFELKILEESLSINQSVKELKFQNFGMSTAFMETVVRILKKNKTIKNLKFDISPIPSAPWSRFCEGLEYYNIEEIRLCHPELKDSHMKEFCEGILSNRTIRSIAIEREWTLGGNVFEILCNMLVNHSMIEKFELVGIPNTSIDFHCLSRVINTNFLKVLSLRQCFCSEKNMNAMSTALKQNTSITELCLQTNLMSFLELGAILHENKSVTKLNLSNSGKADEDSVEYLKLTDNKILTELDVSDCRNISMSNLLGDLEHNTTLKILRIGNNGPLQQSTFEHFLIENTTLEELIIGKHQYPHVMPVYAMALTSALKINKSLRKLVVPLEGIESEDLQRFIDALKVNTTLTHLSFGPFKERNHIKGMSDEELLVDLLKTNKILRHIEGAETSKRMQKGLKRNKETQDKNISDTRILIKMILMKPNSFILPIEVWSNIFKHLSYSFTPFDFEKYFNGPTM